LKSILLVDDEPLVVAFIGAVAKSLGFRIEAAKDGPEALWLFAMDPNIDALVTDVRMPGMDGFELAETLRAKRPGLPILIISGYFEKDAAALKSFFGRRGNHYLVKPFTREQLIERLEGLFRAPAAPG
jgi:CheY-like chemotaxis protein